MATSSKVTGMDTTASSDIDVLKYRMDHPKRGRFIIINNKVFKSREERKGTDLDAERLVETFTRLQFEVVRHDNVTAGSMLRLMTAEEKRDHKDCDCFGVAVLTHGEEGKLLGTDGVVDIDSFLEPLKSCESLFNKPKLIFFQACRGEKLDAGVLVVQADSGGDTPNSAKQILLPREADFLYAYSTVPGYFSWRNALMGSWFIQALCSKLDELAFGDIDLVRILTRVNHKVATEFTSKTNKEEMRDKKEIPSIVSMLRKDVYFTRKP